jgi:hypothetical protein
LSQAPLWKAFDLALRNIRESLISRRVKRFPRLEIERPERAAHDSGLVNGRRKPASKRPEAVPGRSLAAARFLDTSPCWEAVMALTNPAYDAQHNPVDVVERLATTHDWAFSRASDDEVTILVNGQWSDYQVSFTWMPDVEALHLACAFELKVPERRRSEVTELTALINEQLWVGHFDAWLNDGIIMFRHAIVLTAGLTATDGQCEAVLSIALDACERHYQAFQFVVWAGKSPRQALDSIMFETSGEA